MVAAVVTFGMTTNLMLSGADNLNWFLTIKALLVLATSFLTFDEKYRHQIVTADGKVLNEVWHRHYDFLH